MPRIALIILAFTAFFATACRNVSIEDQIVLVNIDTLDKSGVAGQLDYINGLNPAVVVIDLQFTADADPRQDTILVAALRHTKHRVMAAVIDNYQAPRKIEYHTWIDTPPVFQKDAKIGFANTIIDENQLRTLSRFQKYVYVKGEKIYHLAIMAAREYDSIQTDKFVDHYKIDPVPVDFHNGTRRFRIINPADIFNNKLSPNDIQGKIIMLGFLGPGTADKFFTPLNKNPEEPDMYGVEYLAHIVAQILD